MFFKDISDDLKNSLIAKSNIFVMPSIIHKTSVEGFGIAYVEAAQYGMFLLLVEKMVVHLMQSS